ncbi:alpha/beta hydrolase [Actinomadura sp. DC4]|uniref:alpha/beta fold hydrolase n=1 Tax=Actinomadura sp. DC4 TaxID=3055069 RepID=UPI0025B1ADAF|nr:alpha/beta hydrolase [Actinomadura sp. DC4]MDN3359251.1 alpha/beta hydrolase [Actinomadura sp. DC4]
MTENASAAAVSADGTTIAFTAWGEGEPLIIVDGATAYPAINPTNEEVGRLLSGEFRTYAYDRRGRGGSTDTGPYAVEREIEDLFALIEVAGAPATVFGWSSGAVLALDAAAAGLPIKRLALFEPPFVVDDSRPPLPSDYVERLDAAVADGRPGDAAELFLTAAAGLPAEAVGGMRQSEFWPIMESVAPTIAYDGRIMGTTMSGAPLPGDRWAAVTAPTLVLHGTGTYPFIIAGAQALAELLPSATLRAVEGEQHSAPAGVLAAALRDFAH